MSEIWKQIPEHNNYEASNMGRVRRIGSTECLVPNYKGKGYGRLQIDGRRVRVQHLILETFVGPRPEGQICRHLNGIRPDNRLENLKWGTHQENSDDALEHGTGKHKLSKLDVLAIILGYKEGMSIVSLGNAFGVEKYAIKYHLRRAGLK